MAPANMKILNSDINVGRQALCPGGGALLQRYCLPSSSIRTMRAGSAKYLSSISRISIRGGRPRENLISRCGLGALDKYFPLAEEEESPLSLLRPSLFHPGHPSAHVVSATSIVCCRGWDIKWSCQGERARSTSTSTGPERGKKVARSLPLWIVDQIM